MIHVAFALLLIQGAGIEEAVAKGLKIDAGARAKAEAKGKDRKEILAALLDPRLFVEGVRRIDSKLGLWNDRFDIAVGFGATGAGWPAWSDGGGGKGRIEIDAEVLAAYAKQAKTFEEQAKRGATFIVPPARMDGILWHELTHCFLSGTLPDWLNEGACAYVAGDPHFVAYFRNDKQAVREIDADIAHKYAYARGWAFLEWIEAKQGAAKVKAFIALAAKRPAPEAAAEVCGMTWEKLKSEERAWSAKWIADKPAR